MQAFSDSAVLVENRNFFLFRFVYRKFIHESADACSFILSENAAHSDEGGRTFFHFQNVVHYVG